MARKRPHWPWRAVAILLGLLAAAAGPPAQASRVKARSLREMVASAGTIFSGRVEALEFDQIRGLPVTRVTFRVDEGLRGAARGTLTLTFPGGVQANGFPYRVSGLSSFRAGERLILLTYPASPVGLTSPVGLHQGRFTRHEGPGGLQTVVAMGPRSRRSGASGRVSLPAGAAPKAIPLATRIRAMPRIVRTVMSSSLVTALVWEPVSRYSVNVRAMTLTSNSSREQTVCHSSDTQRALE